MSVVLTERNRLATPVELSVVPPPSFTGLEVARASVATPHDGTPDFVLAARAFAQAHDDSAAALVQLAQAEQSIGEIDEAVAAAQRALSLVSRDRDDPIVFAAVQVLLATGNGELAGEALAKINNKEIRDLLRARVAIDRGRFDEGAELLDGLASAEAVATRGWLHLQMQHFDKAIRLFRKAIESDGATVPLLTNLGYAHAASGARQKAIRITRQAQALAPDDELVGFNLVSFYIADDDLDAARAELSRLRAVHPTRLRFDLAEAGLYLWMHQPDQALVVLRRARTSSLWAYAEQRELAELEANLAFVEWRLGRTTREAAASVVVSQLKRTGFQSLDIARLVPALLSHRRDANQLGELYKSLAEVHTSDTLLFLETHIALAGCQFDRATELAREWATKEIFDAHAAGLAVYLLTEVKGAFDDAIALGNSALRVAGSSDDLRNNLAYVYALAGRLGEARELLRDHRPESVHLTATEGLVEILSGSIERGSALYDRAYEIASRQSNGDPTLPTLVRLNQSLALYRAGTEDELKLELPAGWEKNPHLVLFQQAAERARNRMRDASSRRHNLAP